jgi:hypothetical protein
MTLQIYNLMKKRSKIDDNIGVKKMQLLKT